MNISSKGSALSLAIEVTQLKKHYRGAATPALNGVDFSVEAGEIFGVVGPNGAGKTTLFGCLLGHLHHEGEVLVGGIDPREPEARRNFGYVPERLTFESWMKAQAFVGFHYDMSGQPSSAKAEAVSDALHKVGIDRADWNKKVIRFSRGNLQRLALAQAMVGRPEFLFLDEPTSGMDPLGVVRFKEIVRELAASGCTVIFNSHQLAQVQDLCSRVLFLEKGQLLQIETLAHGHLALKGRSSKLAYHVRWLESKEAAAKVKTVAARHKVALEMDGEHSALFTVRDEAQGSQLLSLLVRAGVKVAQAGLQVKDLEQEFKRAFGRKP
jgi:ABC-2 type transport system ATP-binding protein